MIAGFWTGRAVSFLGSEFSLLGLPLFGVVVLGLEPSELALVLAAAGVPALLGPLFAGPLADLVDRRRLCVAADSLRCLALLAIVPLHLAGWLNVPALVGVQLVLGAAEAVFDTALFAWLPSLFPGAALVAANGRLESLRSGAQFAGPALAGALMHATNAVAALVVDGFSFAVSAIGLSRLPPPGRSAATSPPGPASSALDRYRSQLAAGWHALRRLPAVAFLGLVSGVFNLFSGVADAVFLYLLTRTFGLSPLAVGVILSAGFVGGAVGGLLAARLVGAAGLRTCLVAGLLASSVAEFGTVLAPAGSPLAPPLIAGAYFVATFGVVNYITANATLRQALVPDAVRGRVFAVLRVLTRGAVPLGILLGGVLVVSMSPRAVLFVAGVGQLGTACWLALRRRVIPARLAETTGAAS